MTTITLPQPPPPASSPSPHSFTATRNACKLCAPLGASVVFRGIEGAVPFLHGSQGCATYIRRYVISHFKEPLDIGSSNFSEHSVIFGGSECLQTGLTNIVRQYTPSLIGVASTCLSETIGDNVPMILHEYRAKQPGGVPVISVSTPSYAGTHMDGFHAAVRALVDHFTQSSASITRQVAPPVVLLPGFVSPADLRHLKEILHDLGLLGIILPDYSETLDGPIWAQYERLPAGGTSIAALESMRHALSAIEFSRTLSPEKSAAQLLASRCDLQAVCLGLPIGIRETDAFFAALAQLTGAPLPTKYQLERGQLVDSYVDGHKYLFGQRVVLYGEEDLVVGLAAFCAEVGLVPVLCASGGRSGRLAAAIAAVAPALAGQSAVRDDVDFEEIGEFAATLQPDLLIGSSKGYTLARKLAIPLVRVGFPIHDRIGGQRILHLGYRGTQQLFDRIVNAVMEQRQTKSDVGYAYM